MTNGQKLDATNLIDFGHAKPALTTWGAGGVETISYYRTRTPLEGRTS
jgi:hypothetical protein